MEVLGRGVRGRDHCTVPDQLVVDKELEFRVEVGKTDTEGGPVLGREHREEVVDRRAVSTTHKHATDKSQKSHTNMGTDTYNTRTHTDCKGGGGTLKKKNT